MLMFIKNWGLLIFGGGVLYMQGGGVFCYIFNVFVIVDRRHRRLHFHAHPKHSVWTCVVLNGSFFLMF